MDTLQLVFGIILLVSSVFLIIAVLMQSGKSHNLSGAIAGGAETFFGKTKGKTIDRVLNRLTTIVAIIFVILVVVVFVIQPEEGTAAEAAASTTASTTVASDTVATDASVSDTTGASESTPETEASVTE